MPQMLLINPRTRTRKMVKKSRSAAQRRATAKLIASNRARKRRVNPVPIAANPKRRRARRNPISTIRSRAAMRRRRNPMRAVSRVTRRRNPISMGGVTLKGLLSQARDAAIGAGGAIAVDVAYARLNPMLPATLQKMPGVVGVGDAVKAALTVVAGKLLSRVTKGLSSKMAQGALTVQAHSIISSMLPAGMLGYYSPARIVQGSNRVGPTRAANGVSAYLPPGSKTPLLNAYMRRGTSPLLSGMSAREREMGAVR